MSQPDANANWPPKSPHEVLLYTPGGRNKLKRLAERGSPSPSPSKRPGSFAQERRRRLLEDRVGMEGSDDNDDEDDEETLQLQLQEIQARLKLKKLQKKSRQGSDNENDSYRTGSGSGFLGRSSSAAALGRVPSRIADSREARLQKSDSQACVQIPASPVRRVQPSELPKSPSRILLGIDKGLRGGDISLKRAPSLRKPQEDLRGPFLQRPVSQVGSRVSRPGTSASRPTEDDRPKTFSERMAAVRSQDLERQEKDFRIQKNRSKTFDIDQKTIQNYKDTAIELPNIPQAPPEFTREDILQSLNKPVKSIPRSQTDTNLRSAMRTTSNVFATTVHVNKPVPQIVANDSPMPEEVTRAAKSNEGTDSDASSFEPFSSVHLSKRIIPHKELTRILSGKKTFVVPDLLREIKGPDFSSPDIEEDLVLFAVIASKSNPVAHKNTDNQSGKFMVMTLTDLKWELDLYLFKSAFDKFWKLTPGTIIAILNPGVMPPRKGTEATGKFSLTLNSDADTVLEVGSARDLGFCKAIKKDGKTCDSWVNKRHTEYCGYHTNEALRKTTVNRMEVNTMTFGRGRGGGAGERKSNSRDFWKRKEEAKMAENTPYDKASHSQLFISKRSTASMLDDVDIDPDAFHRGSTKQERVQKNLLAKEKERELERKLGAMGNGLGADYMRKRSKQPAPHERDMVPAEPPPDAGALGLLGGNAKDVMLGPIKRKRTDNPSRAAAVGWGGNLTKQLGKMKDGESLQPTKKKTRFVTEKGIREAGRESFGGEAAKTTINDLDDDDDDDLDIVRE